jgi:hypothetical protein
MATTPDKRRGGSADGSASAFKLTGRAKFMDGLVHSANITLGDGAVGSIYTSCAFGSPRKMKAAARRYINTNPVTCLRCLWSQEDTRI